LPEHTTKGTAASPGAAHPSSTHATAASSQGKPHYGTGGTAPRPPPIAVSHAPPVEPDALTAPTFGAMIPGVSLQSRPWTAPANSPACPSPATQRPLPPHLSDGVGSGASEGVGPSQQVRAAAASQAQRMLGAATAPSAQQAAADALRSGSTDTSTTGTYSQPPGGSGGGGVAGEDGFQGQPSHRRALTSHGGDASLSGHARTAAVSGPSGRGGTSPRHQQAQGQQLPGRLSVGPPPERPREVELLRSHSLPMEVDGQSAGPGKDLPLEQVSRVPRIFSSWWP